MAGRRLDQVTEVAEGSVTGTLFIIGYDPSISAPTKSAVRMQLDAIKSYLRLSLGTDDQLKAWTESGSYSVLTQTANSDGLVISATLKWPDHSAGVYNVTSVNATFGTVDAYTITHAVTGKTITQDAVTRDSNGIVSTKPELVVTPPGDTFTYPYTNFIGGAGYYPDDVALRASNDTFTIAILGVDANGVPNRTFIRGIGAGTDDGVNFIMDAGGDTWKGL